MLIAITSFHYSSLYVSRSHHYALKERCRRLEADTSNLRTELDTVTRQRDNARAELAASEVRRPLSPAALGLPPPCQLSSQFMYIFPGQSRLEAEREKLEANATAKTEAEVLRRLTQEQERASQAETRLRETHRQQIEHAAQRQRAELDDVNTRHEQVS